MEKNGTDFKRHFTSGFLEQELLRESKIINIRSLEILATEVSVYSTCLGSTRP
jgi:hypothetical protein